MKRTAILLLLATVSCSRSGPSKTAASAVDPAASAQADEIFKTRCTPCHGPNGRGDGPASASLSPHPRNFTDKQWQTAVSDEHIGKILQYGGAAVGKSPAMPANPDLTGNREVVVALRKHIRTFDRD